MRARSALAAAAASMLVVLGAAVSLRAAPAAADDDRAAEVARIRAHFDSVLAELRARDVSALDPIVRARRTQLIATLRLYRDRGEFPRNHDFPGQAVPYFVDRESGARCAVAHLLESTGRQDVVARVAAASNNVRVADLAGDTALVAWLDRSGLTLAEAARIQPVYNGPPFDDRPPAPRRSTALTVGSVAATSGALAAAYWNARPNASGAGQLGNTIGLAVGAASVAMGAAVMSGDRVAPALGAANVVAGAASLWLSTRGVLRHRRAVARRDAARATNAGVQAGRREPMQASLAPLLPLDGRGAGVMVSLRY